MGEILKEDFEKDLNHITEKFLEKTQRLFGLSPETKPLVRLALKAGYVSGIELVVGKRRAGEDPTSRGLDGTINNPD